MTGRAVPEWRGKTPTTPAPPRVILRLCRRAKGRCQECTRKVGAAHRPFAVDHVIALINGGENRESNLQILCVDCHQKKTGADVAEKAKVDRVAKSAIGIRSDRRQKIPARPFAKAPAQHRATKPLRKPAAWRGNFQEDAQ